MDWRDYLTGISLMQLATCHDNQPWLCNVWFVLDKGSNQIFFMSRKTRRHSLEIENNPNVSCTFHKWYDEGLGQKGQAVTVSGKAQLLTEEKDIAQAYTLYGALYPQLPQMQSHEHFIAGTGPHFFYSITPQEIVVWDEARFPDQPRQPIRL